MREYYYYLSKAEKAIKNASENPYAPRDINYQKLLFDTKALKASIEAYLSKKKKEIAIDVPERIDKRRTN